MISASFWSPPDCRNIPDSVDKIIENNSKNDLMSDFFSWSRLKVKLQNFNWYLIFLWKVEHASAFHEPKMYSSIYLVYLDFVIIR